MTATMTTTIDKLNAMSAPDFSAALANIFEYSPWVAESVVRGRPFADAASLFAAMKAAVLSATAEQKLALIQGHPDLANKTQRAAGLTAESTAEQGSAGLDRLSEAEFAEFDRVNSAYKAKFGFPYIVCIRRQTKDAVLQDFERRLPNDRSREIEVSLSEIMRIAALRVDQLVENSGLQLNGRLSTHVLDTHSGKPAPGVPVTLTEISKLGENRRIAQALTNADGRTDAPLIGGRPMPTGEYELLFEVAGYFSARGVPLSTPPFLDRIPIRFSISEPEGHIHVPLLVTPWSYATYRGS